MSPSTVPAAPARRVFRNRLLPFERRWAEALFDAILGIDTSDGLPAFAAIDRAVFWRVLEEAPPLSFRLGLRACVYTLSVWPILDRRWRRPFFRLSREARLAAIGEFDRDPRYLVRQMLAVLKMLACFAYFDAPAARARFAVPHGGASGAAA